MMSQRSPSRRPSGGWRSAGYTRRRRSSERSRERSRERDNYDRRGRSRSRSSSGGEEDGHRLHVADLGAGTTKRDLEDAFRKFGPLVEVWLARSPQCFAFIVFHRKEDASEAMRAMNSKKLDGSRIRVTKARPRTRGSGRRRGYNPNLRCYLCGRQGHFSRDCRKNDGRHGHRHSSKDRSPTPSRSHSRSRSSSSSRSGRRRRRSSSGSRSRSRSHSRSSSRSRSRDRSRGRKKKNRRKSKSRSPSRNKKPEDKETNPSPEKKTENGKDLEKKGSALIGLDYDSNSPHPSPDRGGSAVKAGESAATTEPQAGASTVKVNSSQPTGPAMSAKNGTTNNPPTTPLPRTTTVQTEENILNTSASVPELA